MDNALKVASRRASTTGHATALPFSFVFQMLFQSNCLCVCMFVCSCFCFCLCVLIVFAIPLYFFCLLFMHYLMLFVFSFVSVCFFFRFFNFRCATALPAKPYKKESVIQGCNSTSDIGHPWKRKASLAIIGRAVSMCSQGRWSGTIHGASSCWQYSS